ncbi:GNAT family N-acetyltransferase [Terrisporobacter sp.]|uniref:GNAT family N-acetyltransferase n=1 Tax=Terrisporobacter sp. TaxID=1965305 RepID=UPI0026102C68|nr:GNAT family N-acetyltransferase [Terrisporobacter sp.]
MKKHIRFATIDDTEKILSIYEPYIKNTAITFEYDIPSLDEFSTRIKNICKDYPYLVCEIDGKIAGYAYANRAMSRAAFNWNVELSIYIDTNYRGQGIGKSLYSALLKILTHQNIVNVYALVVTPNESSEKLHKYFGFEEVGLHPNTGYKLGNWHNLSYLCKVISNFDNPPKKFISINDLDKNIVESILNECI